MLLQEKKINLSLILIGILGNPVFVFEKMKTGTLILVTALRITLKIIKFLMLAHFMYYGKPSFWFGVVLGSSK